jgi:putative transposase
MPKLLRFAPEFKAQAVRLVFESMEPTESRKEACRRLAPEVNVKEVTLYNWVKEATAPTSTAKPPAGSVEELRVQIAQLKRENKELEEVSLYVAVNRDRFGLEPICRVEVNASTVRSRLARPPSATAIADEDLKAKIRVIFDANYRAYCCRKIKAVLAREHDLVVDKDRVARLMGQLGIRGVVRGRKVFTTKSDPAAERVPDLVNRVFTAERPNALWVSDFTYVPSWAGMVYVAFVLDVYSRFIVGWRASTTMRTDLVVDALNQGVHARCTMLAGLVTHSVAGSQYTSIRYTERLARDRRATLDRQCR